MTRNVLLAASIVLTLFLSGGGGVGRVSANHGGSPSNFDFETAGGPVGSPPLNHNFATGDFTDWTKTGTAVVESGGPSTSGKYAKLGNGGSGSGTIISSAFTVDASAQIMSFQRAWLGTGGTNYLFVNVLYGTNYGSSKSVYSTYCACTGDWEQIDFSVNEWRGQSIKIKLQGYRYAGVTDVGVGRTELVDWTMEYDMAFRQPDGPTGYYAYMPEGENPTLTSSTFGLDCHIGGDGNQYCPESISLWYTFLEDDTTGNQFQVFLKKTSDSNWTSLALITSYVAVPWTQRFITLSPTWQGATVQIKVAVTIGSGPIGFDDVGLVYDPAYGFWNYPQHGWAAQSHAEGHDGSGPSNSPTWYGGTTSPANYWYPGSPVGEDSCATNRYANMNAAETAIETSTAAAPELIDWPVGVYMGYVGCDVSVGSRTLFTSFVDGAWCCGYTVHKQATNDQCSSVGLTHPCGDWATATEVVKWWWDSRADSVRQQLLLHEWGHSFGMGDYCGYHHNAMSRNGETSCAWPSSGEYYSLDRRALYLIYGE